MKRALYAGTPPPGRRRKSRAKRIFFVVVIAHVLVIGYCVHRAPSKNRPKEAPKPTGVHEPSIPAPSGPNETPPTARPATRPTAASRAALLDARAAIDAGQLPEAQKILERIVAANPSPEAVSLLGEVNLKLLKSPSMMPGKEYYVVRSGDCLQKVARKYHTTVALVKDMNGMQSDVIRIGERLLVFSGDFSVRVSKSRNVLDLLLNGKLFKRYRVGTGKFGKTPAVEFVIVDKIKNPPWTRPSDGKKLEYGDPENLLGTRWMALKSADHPELTGFGIHGTWQRDSIGKQSSNGCIRMLNEEVEELFDILPRNTKIAIVE